MPGINATGYRLPGGVTARIGIGRQPAGRAVFLDAKLGFYRTPDLPPDQPVDIEMQCGRFELAPPADAVVVDKDFLVAQDYLAFTGRHGRGATEIRGVEAAERVLIRHCPVRERLCESFRLGLRGIAMVFEPMLKYLYRRRGYRLLHGGAMMRDNRALLVLGSNGTHKTRIILEMCLHHGWEFGGDDLVLLRDGHVEPLVESHRVLYERARRLFAGKRLDIPLLRLARLYLASPPPCPEALRIGRQTPVTGVLVLERQAHPGPAVTSGCAPLLPTEFGARLRQYERMELCRHQRRHHPLTPFDRFIMAYEYARPGSRFYADMLGAGAADAAGNAALPSLRVGVPASLTPEDLTRLRCGCEDLVRKGVP